MMYGFGDDQNPYSESVDLLEDLVIEYISEMVTVFQSHNMWFYILDASLVYFFAVVISFEEDKDLN